MKILIRLPNWIGDTVMATPFLEELKKHYPHASFTLVGPKSCMSLLSRNFVHANTIVDDSKQFWCRIYRLYQLAQQIRTHDLSFTLQNNFLSALLLFMSGSKMRIGYKKECRGFLLTHAIATQKNMHQVQRYYHLLTSLNIPSELPPPLYLYTAPHSITLPAKINIGINTGGAFGSAKRWSKAHFMQTTQILLEYGYGVILFGGQEDRATNHEISTSLKKYPHLMNLTGKTSLQELTDIIASLNVFITNDSGPMHIAAALQVPIVAIFGPTDPTETSPWKAKAALISKNLSCSPCKKRICPLKHHACMEELDATKVIAATQNFLNDE